MVHQCIRCKRNIRKYARKVGHTLYVTDFLKSEHGLCEEEVENGYLCNPCRSFTIVESLRQEPAGAASLQISKLYASYIDVNE